jgi:phospholipase/carboxylesterase
MKTQKNLLNCIKINPDRPATATILWLHGLGADGNDFAPIVPELQLPGDLAVRFVFPNAPLMPVTINNGYVMPAWFDIISMNMDQRADQAGITESVMALHQLIEHEEQNGVPADKIIIGGFSQGAVIALTAGLRFPKRLAGIFALSGYLPFANEVMAQTSLAARDTPILVAHGTEDTVVPYSAGLATCDVLQRSGLQVSWHSYAMAHSVCGKEIQDLREFFVKNL